VLGKARGQLPVSGIQISTESTDLTVHIIQQAV